MPSSMIRPTMSSKRFGEFEVIDRPPSGSGLGVEHGVGASQRRRLAPDRRADLVHQRRTSTCLVHLVLERFMERQAVPGVRVPGCVAHHHRPKRPDHDRRPRRLDRTGIHDRPSYLVEVTRERCHLVAQEAIDDLDIFREPGDAFLRLPVGDADHAVRRVVHEARPQPDLESAMRDVIERQGLASEQRRVPEWDLRNAAAESDGRRGGCQPSECRPGLEPRTRRVGPVDEMIR